MHLLTVFLSPASVLLRAILEKNQKFYKKFLPTIPIVHRVNNNIQERPSVLMSLF